MDLFDLAVFYRREGRQLYVQEFPKLIRYSEQLQQLTRCEQLHSSPLDQTQEAVRVGSLTQSSIVLL